MVLIYELQIIQIDKKLYESELNEVCIFLQVLNDQVQDFLGEKIHIDWYDQLSLWGLQLIET